MHCVTFHLPSFVLSLFASSPRLSLFIPLFFILLCRFVQSAFYCFLMSEFLFISLSLFLPPPPIPRPLSLFLFLFFSLYHYLLSLSLWFCLFSSLVIFLSPLFLSRSPTRLFEKIYFPSYPSHSPLHEILLEPATISTKRVRKKMYNRNCM